MRKLFLLLCTVVALAGCYGPHTDLRYPICIVIPDKITDRTQELALHDAIIRGTADWTKHLEPYNFGPYVTDKSSNCDNPPIVVRIKNLLPDKCGYASAHIDHHTIDIDPTCITARVFAHELGHTIWAYSHINDGTLSIMSPTANFYVSPKDMERLCDVHHEITCHPMIWCKDDFQDDYRCPSATPEEGDAKLRWSWSGGEFNELPTTMSNVD